MAEPNAKAPFDAFDVSTWASYIDQADPRMISFDLRRELESAYDVHPFSAKCRQAVLKSLLLWATMSHAQRTLIAWDNPRNVQLGQALIQHLLDLTAEVNGVNSDDIYAALQADQHPFLKKMHEIMSARGGAGGDAAWHLRGDRGVAAVEARRSTTTAAVSPAPHRDAALRAPTVLAESIAREDVSQPPDYVSPPATASDHAPPPPVGQEEVKSHAKPPPPTPLQNTATTFAAPPAESRPPPPPFAVAVKESATNGHVAPPPPPPPPSLPAAAPLAKEPASAKKEANGSAATQPPPPPPVQHQQHHEVAEQQQQQSAPVTRESLVRKVVHTTPAASAKPAPQSQAVQAAAEKPASAAPPPPPAKAAPASPPAPSAAAPPRVEKKTNSAASPPPPPPAAKPAPYVAPKKYFTYSDSSSDSDSSVDVPPPAAPAARPPAASAKPAAAEAPATATAVPLASEADLQKYGEDGVEDLLQAFYSELPTDVDGVSAWFERRLAITKQDRDIALHVEAPAPLSVEKVKKRMTAATATRLEALMELLAADAPLEVLPHNEAAAFLSLDDVKHLAQADLIRPCKKLTGPDTVIAFTVVDKGEKAAKRRFVSWPCGSNRNALENGYEPLIPLHHISSYLDAVNAPAGCVETLASCFDQIALPPNVQDRFVFTDAANKRWCLTRLPMGHTVAAEIVNLLFSTLAGQSLYALPPHTVPSAVKLDVWVRNARFYGMERDVQSARDKFCAACKECGATLSTQHVGVGGAAYDFVGVHFDHTTHKVSVQRRNIRRIAPLRQSITTRDLERQYTQLLFSASVLNVAASKFYKLLRTVCRRLSQAMQNPDLLFKAELLPHESYAQLEKWHREVMQNAPRSVKRESLPNMTLFVELSSESWFSVLIGEETQETWNTGGMMDDMLGTKVASACITRAVECFEPCIEKGAHLSILILGGNTLAPNERQICKNEPKEAIDDCIRTHLVTRAFSFEVDYIGLSETKTNGPKAAPHKPLVKGNKKF